MKALTLHYRLKGKLTIDSKLPLKTKKDLTLLYTPGVAEVVKAISNDPAKANNLTIKNNCLAVVTDGSAVLGLGNVGPLAALPVMEGKCAIFKEFAQINAFPICLDTQDTDEIINSIKNIAPVFGGINLEDISAPRCFEIEEKLSKILSIPVMHDDQHATAIVVLAGLINACKVTKRNLKKSKIAIAGAGAAGIAIAGLLNYFGVNNIILADSQGIISPSRKNLPMYKRKLLKWINPERLSGLLSDIKDSDILIGVSLKGIFTKKIISNMSSKPIVFALANPEPEINFKKATEYGVCVYACGRSDFPNQINNALVFPGFFKGLLDKKIRFISPQMKLNAALALSSLVKKPTREYFIPSIFDKRLVKSISQSL